MESIRRIAKEKVKEDSEKRHGGKDEG